MHHVFCDGQQPMPYGHAFSASLSGWQTDATDLRAGGPPDWTFWGSYRLIDYADKRVLLYKSNTHLDWPGRDQLAALTDRLINACHPQLILSIGTAGGAVPTDHVGTVRAVRAATLYAASLERPDWPTYRSDWVASWASSSLAGFTDHLMRIPTTDADLQSLTSQLNNERHTNYTLKQLDPNNTNRGEPSPSVYNQVNDGTPLLTASTFVVGTDDGAFADFSTIEMDDAVVDAECASNNIDFGSIRNVSDPAQPVALPVGDQAAWGSMIYRAYGPYTSFSGALVTASMLGSTPSA